MTYSREATALSESTSQPINAWTKACVVLKMSKNIGEAFFSG
jgi:hypothetical protein